MWKKFISTQPFPTNPINALEARVLVYLTHCGEVIAFPTNPINALEASIHED